jgi:MoaA/NifB/PqqE/SkfB family radical SAM enzyme
MQFFIEVAGKCNLRCPTCPSGQNDQLIQSSGMMTEDRLQKIIEKGINEFGTISVGLYNWSDPLLNNNIHRLVKLVRSYGISCSLSTNLNVLRDVDELVAADPSQILISTSGFTQDTYALGHKNGNIDKLKHNMQVLAGARKRYSENGYIPGRCIVVYHKYADNASEEIDMRIFAEALDFSFMTAWAHFLPVEKLVALAGADNNAEKVTEDDKKSILRLAIPFERMFRNRELGAADNCVMPDRDMMIDVEGNAWLCCVSSADRLNMVGNYLDSPAQDIQKKRKFHPSCTSCMSLGIPNFFNFSHLPAAILQEANTAYRSSELRLTTEALEAAYNSRGINIRIGVDLRLSEKINISDYAIPHNGGVIYGFSPGMSMQEISFIENLHAVFRPKKILVIGNSFGWNPLSFALAFPEAEVVSVEQTGEVTIGLDLTNSLAGELHLPLKARQLDNLNCLWDVANNFCTEGCDLIFFDKLISDDQRILYLEILLKFTSKNCVILFHSAVEASCEKSLEILAQLDGWAVNVLYRTTSGIGFCYNMTSDYKLRRLARFYSDASKDGSMLRA